MTLSSEHRSERTPGSQLADHDILSTAGRGSSAVVYLARHRPSGSLRALKVLDERVEDGDQHAQATTPALALSHADIITVHACGKEDGVRWLSMEWVPGHDLGRYLRARWLLPESLALELAARLALALDHAHRHGVIHRDIKPANIRIHLPQRILKIGDFDIAKVSDSTATLTGVLKGTPVYMAPELLAGAPPSAQSDLYAVGVVLHEMLTGHRPHEADSMGELLRKLSTQTLAPPSRKNPAIPDELDALFLRLLSAKPQARPASGALLADELLAISGRLSDAT